MLIDTVKVALKQAKEAEKGDGAGAGGPNAGGVAGGSGQGQIGGGPGGAQGPGGAAGKGKRKVIRVRG